MRLKMVAVACLSLAAITPAGAQDAPQPAATPAPTQQPAPAAPPAAEKRVCRRPPVTGSILIARPVCHTRAEWAQINGTTGDDALRALDIQRTMNAPTANNQ